MRAIQFETTGGPEVLKLVELATPEPGPGQVRLRHQAIGINFIETYQRTGLYPVRLPAIPGGEAAGLASFRQYVAAAEAAHARGLGVNAGHDLDLKNLPLFRALPHLDEGSIGHALMSHALFVGLPAAVRDYLAAVGATA